MKQTETSYIIQIMPQATPYHFYHTKQTRCRLGYTHGQSSKSDNMAGGILSQGDLEVAWVQYDGFLSQWVLLGAWGQISCICETKQRGTNQIEQMRSQRNRYQIPNGLNCRPGTQPKSSSSRARAHRRARTLRPHPQIAPNSSLPARRRTEH